MRWQNLGADSCTTPALFRRDAVTRTFDTRSSAASPSTKYAPGRSSTGFRATPRAVRMDDQPLPGAQSRQRLLLRPQDHSHVDLDTGRDFDSQIVVKVKLAHPARPADPGRGRAGHHGLHRFLRRLHRHGLWRSVEPGAPSPGKRLEACRTLTSHGIPSAVLMAPVLPSLSDSPSS
jgi:hypothetical protein